MTVDVEATTDPLLVPWLGALERSGRSGTCSRRARGGSTSHNVILRGGPGANR
jgi:hypothetical protein